MGLNSAFKGLNELINVWCIEAGGTWRNKAWYSAPSTRPDRPWGPTSLLYNWNRFFPEGKAAGTWR